MMIGGELGSGELPGSILDSLSDAFFAVDHDWRFTYVNPAAVPLLRHYSGELRALTLWDALPGIVGTEFEWQFRGNMVNRRKDGALYEEHMTITPVRDTAGQLSHFIAVKEEAMPSERPIATTEVALAG